MDLIEGDKIRQYSVVRKIASGGMGDVFLADDTTLGRQVVLKVLADHVGADEVVKLRFLHEARSTAALNHPNIVTIYEVGEADGCVFMAMEYVEGKTIAQLVARGGMDSSECLDVAIQLCQGLEAAHRAGVSHRDIKPANVMVNRSHKVTIVDFGLARLEGTDRLTRDGALVGTVGYMSPEQGQGLQTDHRTDIFSTAVVLQEMLSGTNPFDRDSIPATIHAIVCSPAEPLKNQDDPVLAGLQQVLDRALAKDCADRYQSMADLRADLEQIRDEGELLGNRRRKNSSQRNGARAMAILPLRNPTNDDLDHLCYGISEDLAIDLARIGTIRVIPMRKVQRFKNSDEDIETIAEELEADFVFDGSLLRIGDAIKISAQLIDAASGETVWADKHEENRDQLPRIKQAMADGIARTMDVSQSAIRLADIRTPVPAKPEAYEYYLRGKYAFEYQKDQSDSQVALNLYEAALADDPSLLAARVGVARVLMQRNDHERASRELLEALTEARRRNSRGDEAMILRTLAQSQITLSHWKRAMKFAEQALEISRAVRDLSGEAEALDLKIQILTTQADFNAALKLLERVLEINRLQGDLAQTAQALRTMGYLHIRRGDYIRAQTLSEKALAIAREKGLKTIEAHCLKSIGITWEFMGKLAKAKDHYAVAMEIFALVGDDNGRAACLNNTANVHYAQGDYRKATEYYERAAAIHEQSGNRASYVLSYNNISTSAIACGEYDRAVEVSLESLDLAREMDYPLVVHDASNCLGMAYFLKDDIANAEKYFGMALEVAREGAIRRCEAMTLAHMGEMYYHLRDYERCLEYSGKGLQIARECKLREFEIKAALYASAPACQSAGYEECVDRLRKLHDETEDHGDPRYIVAALRFLGEAYVTFGPDSRTVDEGGDLLDRALRMARDKEIVYEEEWLQAILSESSKGIERPART